MQLSVAVLRLGSAIFAAAAGMAAIAVASAPAMAVAERPVPDSRRDPISG
jgi:hypothetical protein